MTRALDNWRQVLLVDPCSYCGAPAEEPDHIDAQARGGDDDADNLTASCARCNRSKGAKSLLPFLLDRNRPLTPGQRLHRRFGERMRSRRLALGLTQSELALQLGVDLMAVSRWERGANRPRDASAVAIADALGVPLAWFYKSKEAVAA